MAPSLDDIPPDREDGSSSFVHQALITTARLGQISPLFLLPVWALLIVGVAMVWRASPWSAAVAFAIFVLADWTILALLPLAQRSWGPITPSLLGLGLVHTLLFAVGALLNPGSGLVLTVAANVLVTGTAAYATWIEPFRVRIVRQSYPPQDGPQGASENGARATSEGRTLRIAHLSDLHFEGPSPRERQILSLLEEQAPDLIVLTGDYLNLSSVYDPAAQRGVRAFLASLEAPLGVYAITGSPVVDVEGIVPEIFEGLPIHWLNDRAVPVSYDGGVMWLMGVRNTYDESRDTKALRVLAAGTPDDHLRVLLYHTPDLMPLTATLGLDLYFCGHTHGGQLRLPVYGALATSSKWGKRYEHGRYTEGETTLYVSQGLGVEGLGAPRARFLAPPEIVIWEIRPDLK